MSGGSHWVMVLVRTSGPVPRGVKAGMEGRKKGKTHRIEKTMYPWPSDLVILKQVRILLQKEHLVHSPNLLDTALTPPLLLPPLLLTRPVPWHLLPKLGLLTTRNTQFHYRAPNRTNNYIFTALGPAGALSINLSSHVTWHDCILF